MNASSRSTANTFLTGMVGFLIATLAGIFSSYLIIRLGVFRPLLNLIPENQPLIRLYAGIVSAFLGVGLGGAVNGALRGETLHRIDPQGSRRRYILGGAFAYGITGGILLIPLILVLSLLAQYNPGSEKDPLTFLFVFTLTGALYGLVSGLLLGLFTLRLRYIWLPLLASTAGTGLGGALLGTIIWRQGELLALPTRFLQLIVFLLVLCLALVGLAGGWLAMAYRRVASLRERAPSGSIAPARWQDALMGLGGIALVLLMVSVTGTLVGFITFRPGTVTKSLALETVGVHWREPSPIVSGFSPEQSPAHGLSANSQGMLAAAWVSSTRDRPQVYAAFAQEAAAGAPGWSSPVSVSQGLEAAARHPQIALDEAGRAHVIWAAGTSAGRAIYYSSCQGSACSTPVVLSGQADALCEGAPQRGQNDWPAIAVSHDGVLYAAWNAGGYLAYTTWIDGEAPAAAACFEPLPADGETVEWQPRLATQAAGGAILVYSASHPDPGAPVGWLSLGPDGPGEAEQAGSGGLAEVFAGADGEVHLAWCQPDGSVAYASDENPEEQIAFPPCRGRPGIFQDSDGRTHLVWHSDQVENNFGAHLPDSLIYESIRTAEGWSQPAIVSSAEPGTFLSAAASADGSAYLAWQSGQDGDPALLLARQEPYLCSPESLGVGAQAVLQVIQTGGFHPQGYQSPFCDNEFEGFIYMPNPQATFSDEAPTANGGFDQLALLAQEADYELLLSNMQWDPDQDDLSPGYRIAEGVAALYQRVKDDPAAFPRGMTVRILLGNYPNLANFQWGDQLWGLIADLREAGVEQMEQPSIGWKLEVANFAGTYPHSHTKFMAIDGKALVSAGFNISWYHLPEDHPSGKGDNLTDLGIWISGPVAQEGVAAFDDMWANANQLACADLLPGDASHAWRETCAWKAGRPGHTPEVLKFYKTEGDQTAFALYRTDNYKEADNAYSAALRSAQTRIEAMQVNFSAELICLLNIISPDTCTYDNALPWMEALVDSVEKNHTRVRVIVENANMNGLENRVGIAILRQELARRGVSEYVEVRFFDGRLHTKSTLIDGELLMVGSQNFHYSSFGASGLLEFVTATDSSEAIQAWQGMFEYYWDQAIPSDEAVWGSSGK